MNDDYWPVLLPPVSFFPSGVPVIMTIAERREKKVFFFRKFTHLTAQEK